MTKYRLTDLVHDIRVALDENMSSASLIELGDADSLSLDEVIKSKIEEAARLVILASPSHLLGSGVPFGKSIGWHSAAGYGSGYVIVPDDFLRLVIFQMSDWSRAVYDFITPEDPKYNLQSSRYPGLRGNPQKPVVAITNSSVGRMLEFYSCSSGDEAHIKQAAYIPEPRILGDVIFLCEKLKEPTIYEAAHFVASTMGETEKAAALLNISKQLLEQ